MSDSRCARRVSQRQRAAIKKFLCANDGARARRGSIWQDHNERLEGEIFLANLTQSEFDALPVRTKRLAGPARDYQGEVHQRTHQIYLQLWGEKECFGVFVQRSELERRHIQYTFQF